LPPFLESVHQRFGTPHWAIIGTGLAMGLAITFLPVHDVAELASGFKIMIFMLINACVIVLRTSADSHTWYDPQWKTPWPLYPAVQLFGIFGGGGLLYLMGTKSLVGASVAIVLGLIIYKGYGESRVEVQITPWKTAKLMITDADEAERRRLFAAFYEADAEGDGQLDLDQFVSAFKSLGYIEGGGPNIPDDAIVLSKTRNRRGDQLIGDVFGKGDTDKDGLISIEEFLEVAREIEPEG